MGAIRYLSAAQLDGALPMPAAIDAMQAVFSAAAHTVNPERVFMQMPRPGTPIPARLGAMPAGWAGRGLGAKVVSLIDDNPAAGRPAIQGIAVLLDPMTGAPSLITDAARLTTRRTGAMAGLATRTLAPPQAHRLAVVGAGALAGEMIDAICAVRAIDHIALYSRTRNRTDQLATRLRARHEADVAVATDADIAVTDADVVVLCTTSPEPVIADAALAVGAHINAVGNFSAQGSEVDMATVARAEIWVDTYEGALSEAGELLLAAERGLIAPGKAGIAGDLAALASGAARRGGAGTITMYKSVGTAVADIGALVALREVAERENLGTQLT